MTLATRTKTKVLKFRHYLAISGLILIAASLIIILILPWSFALLSFSLGGILISLAAIITPDPGAE